MLLRLRPFLTCFFICLIPLLLLAAMNFWLALDAAQTEQQKNLQTHLALFTATVNRLLEEEGKQIAATAESPALRTFVATNPSSSTSEGRGVSSANDLPADLKIIVASILDQRSHIERVACFATTRQPLFVAELSNGQKGAEALRIITGNFIPGLPQPHDKVWSLNKPDLLESGVTASSFGSSQAYTAPVFAPEKPDSAIAAFVGQVNLDAILAEAAGPIEGKNENRFNPTVIVIDRSAVVLYHPNYALKHQPVATALPVFASVARAMIASREGTASFQSADGQDNSVVFAPFPRTQAIAAVAMNSSLATAAARRIGWIGIFLSFFLAVFPALALTRYWRKQSRGLHKVTEGVAAIAKGELNHHIDVHSGDEARVIADNINLMTERFREQLAREAEARQFDSFVRLSAMLTHDLKNAIEALSLIVGNMERHFHNEQFRADAMKSLTLATEKLKALVVRITNPVTTLSGERKRPFATDLSALLGRVAGVIVEPVRAKYEIELNLSEPVYALIDAERMEKVIENLVINALEAMSEKGSGKLTITAGSAGRAKVFFSVSDTGCGMSDEFIQQRLFRPFATSKKAGVGLGLYTCREVVRANAGKIEVQSEEGIGTTFRVVLPSATIEGRS